MHKSFEKDHSQKIIFLNKKIFQNSIIYFYQINEPLVESSQNNAASK